jgi:hypothetical protein
LERVLFEVEFATIREVTSTTASTLRSLRGQQSFLLEREEIKSE